jgi:hypothetical protein
MSAGGERGRIQILVADSQEGKEKELSREGESAPNEGPHRGSSFV